MEQRATIPLPKGYGFGHQMYGQQLPQIWRSGVLYGDARATQEHHS